MEKISELNSYVVNNVMKTDIVELSKKRKLGDENFSLPFPKHACYSHPADGSDTESGKGSNTLAGEYEYSSSSSSSTSWGIANYDSIDSMNMAKDESLSSTAEERSPDDGGNQKHSVAEYQNHLELICSEYGIANLEQYTGTEIEDILLSDNDLKNPNTYVLSSGRWSVNQDSQQGARKPTIDQEFEQYFSMLML